MESFKIFEANYDINYDKLQYSIENEIGVGFDDLDTIVLNIIDFEKTTEKSVWLISLDTKTNLNKSSLFQVRQSDNRHQKSPNITPIVKSSWSDNIKIYLRYVYQFELMANVNTVKEYLEQYKILKDRGEQMGFAVKSGYSHQKHKPHISFTQELDSDIFKLHCDDHDKIPNNIITEFENYCNSNMLRDEQRADLVNLINKATS